MAIFVVWCGVVLVFLSVLENLAFVWSIMTFPGHILFVT